MRQKIPTGGVEGMAHVRDVDVSASNEVIIKLGFVMTLKFKQIQGGITHMF